MSFPVSSSFHICWRLLLHHHCGAIVPTAWVIICVKLVRRSLMAFFVSECKTGRRANKNQWSKGDRHSSVWTKSTPWGFLPGINEAFYSRQSSPNCLFVFFKNLQRVTRVQVFLPWRGKWRTYFQSSKSKPLSSPRCQEGQQLLFRKLSCH